MKRLVREDIARDKEELDLLISDLVLHESRGRSQREPADDAAV